MKKIIFSAVILMMLVSTAVCVNAEGLQTSVYLVPEEGTINVLRMQEANLILKASDVSDLYTMQVEMKYDPERLELSPGGITNLAWTGSQSGYSSIWIDHETGTVKLIFSLKGKTQGANGDLNLINIKFKALRIGKTNVEVKSIKLVNSQTDFIDVSIVESTKEIDILPNPLNVNLTGRKGENGWFVTNVNVAITDIDAQQITYIIDGVQYAYTQPFVMDISGIHFLKVITDDGFGFIKQKEYEVKIDINKPTITAQPVSSDWKNTDIQVTPGYTDDGGSGLAGTWYQWAETAEQPSQWEEYGQGTFTVTEEGIWYLHAKATDNAGNETILKFGPYKIDKTVPAIAVDIEKREIWESSTVEIMPTFEDEGGSQIKYAGYKWSLEDDLPSEYDTYSADGLHQTDDGIWYVHLKVEDNAGNIKTNTFGPYKVDKSAPVITVDGVTEGADYTETVIPAVSISDAFSGIKEQSIILDGKAYVSGTPVTEQGVHTLTASGEDLAGNVTTRTVTFKIYTVTTITLNVPQAEYSDISAITATLTSRSQPVDNAVIYFRVNGEDAGAATTDEQGAAVLEYTTLLKAGTYNVEAVFLQDDTRLFRSSQVQSSLIVAPENVVISYAESLTVQYPASTTAAALVFQENDGCDGDLTLARLSIEISKLNADGTVTIVENLSANCDASGLASIVKPLYKGVYSIKISLLDDGYYTPCTVQETIAVYQAGDGFTACGGWLKLPDPSNGELVKVRCNFNVKYVEGLVEGNLKFDFNEVGLQIHDGNITWLVVDGNMAQFQGYDGTYTYRVSCIDNGNADYLTIRIWYGTDTTMVPAFEWINLEQTGGNINVKDR